VNTPEEQILNFVQVLANHPQEVTVKQIDGDPIVFEVTISGRDLVEVSSKQKIIQAIAGYTTGLIAKKVVVKILEK
jgi:hypothetical protein